MTTSLSDTPQAQDDLFTSEITGLTDGNLGIVTLAVLSNDLGGQATLLYSIDDGTNSLQDLSTQDAARVEAVSTDYSANGAHIWITSDGRVGYDAATLGLSFKSELDQLAPGQFLYDTFTYAIRLGNGTLSWATATVQIEGSDHPVIIGTPGPDVLLGTSQPDAIFGLEGNDRLQGFAGNDQLDGGLGFDRAVYTDATGGITVNLAAGTVSGAGVGTDTLVAIEGVIGSDFADTFNATGFTGWSGLPGVQVGQNDFEGKGGDDIIIGAVNVQGQAQTRVSYVSATGAVTVDIAAGTADGDASVGHDVFSNLFSVWGSSSNDTLRGSDNGFATFEIFEGRGGDDLIDGRGGYDRADYANDTTTTSGITVHLAAGTVTGDATVGTDTLRAVEAIRGTNFDDLYDATGFGAAGAANIGSLGTFNDFAGAGGNDTVIGNGNTRLNYAVAVGGITVDLQTTAGTAITVGGTATGLGEGTDSFTGVNAVLGSTFADTLFGSSFNNSFTGLGGDDYIDGRGGFDTAIYNSVFSATGGVSVNLAAGTATSDASIGTDTLRSIEGIQGTFFDDVFVATGYGQAGALNIGNSGNFNQFEGLAGDDHITGNGNTKILYINAAAGVTVDLAAGTASGDASVGTDTFTLVNHATGSAFADTLNGDGGTNILTGGFGNDTIDGRGGSDLAVFSGSMAAYAISFDTPSSGQIQVADSVAGRDGTDALSNIEVLQFSTNTVLVASGTSATPIDLAAIAQGTSTSPVTTFTGAASDFILVSQSWNGQLIDLGAGTDDTVTLGPSGSYSLKLANVEHLVGSGGNDFVGLTNTASGLSVDLGGGTNDVLGLTNGLNSLSVTNIEFVFGGNSNDNIVIANTTGSTTVTGGLGVDTIGASAGQDNFRFVSAADSQTGNGDQIANFDAAIDRFVFHLTGPNGFTGPINFVGSDAFDGTPGAPQSEARFDTASGLLQIDVNGDGFMDSSDIEVHLSNLTGTLTNSNFILA